MSDGVYEAPLVDGEEAVVLVNDVSLSICNRRERRRNDMQNAKMPRPSRCLEVDKDK
jgi:hypothetical protein